MALSLKTSWSDDKKAITAPVNSTTSVNQGWKNKSIRAVWKSGGSQEAWEGELCTAFCTMNSILPGKKGPKRGSRHGQSSEKVHILEMVNNWVQEMMYIRSE